jgi:hypothetical protein
MGFEKQQVRAEMRLKNTENQPENTTLGSINEMFHHSYKALVDRQRQLITDAKLNLLIRMDDRLSLFRGNDEMRFYVNGEAYHRYKAVSHIALATFLMLENHPDTAEEFTTLLKQVDQQDDADVQRVVTVCLHLIAEADGNKLSYRAVRAFSKALASPLARLLDRAANDEVHQCMAALEKVESEYSLDWSATYLVVCDGPQPRYKNLSKMLFKQWVAHRNDQLMEPEYHVIYSESCKSYEDVVELLSRHLAGGVVGDVFMQNPLSLSQDVLGDAAQRALDRYYANTIHNQTQSSGRSESME